MIINLLSKKCAPCEGGMPAFPDIAIREYLAHVPGWEGIFETPRKIRREFTFKNFIEAIEFVNKIAAVAESEQHHPDIHIFYNKVRIELWTHAVGGLSENDFILAAKIDKLTQAQ